jgi:hypothetical protein
MSGFFLPCDCPQVSKKQVANQGRLKRVCSKLVLASMALFVWQGVSQAGGGSSVSGTVADYNITSVRANSGVLTVPASSNFTYTAGQAVPIGTIFTITLPSGITFLSVPALTASNGTTTVLSTGAGGQGIGFQSATFTVGVAPLTNGQRIVLGSFSIQAVPLETLTPAMGTPLSLTMQAIGVDLAPLSLPAFASDAGITAIFVGANEFIDPTPPSNGTEFFGTPDSRTAVINAEAVQAQTGLLSAAGTALTLSPSDTATITLVGNFGGIGQAFSSSTSNCLTPIGGGTVSFGSISFLNVPLNREIFGCVTGNGGIIQANPNGFSTVTVSPGTSTDFVSTAALVESAAFICYGTPGSGCVAFTPPSVSTPTLSGWAMYGLAGIMLLFGVWKLSAGSTA